MGYFIKNIQFVLDIGSSALRLLAVKKIANKPRMIAEEVLVFDGFMDGEFLSPDKLQDDFNQIIFEMENKFRTRIKEITIGVPSEFCLCICKRISRKFDELHKITDKDIIELFENNANFGDSEQYSLINFSPMQYTLDDNFTTLAPVGRKSYSITVDASYILLKIDFIKIMESTLKSIGIKKIDFALTALLQATICARINEATKPIILVDVGHLTTSVAVLKGEGLAMLTSFSMGGGHISADLMNVMGLGFLDAEAIKKKAILTIENDKNANYEICSKGNIIKAPIGITNQVIKSRLEKISQIISEILSIDANFVNYDLYLTGDGILNYKGVKNILGDATNHKILEFKIPLDNTKSKYQTSKLGLVDLFQEMK